VCTDLRLIRIGIGEWADGRFFCEVWTFVFLDGDR